MKPFQFRHGTQAWPAGETLLHVYAIPDLDRDQELAELAAGCRSALAGHPLTFVQDRWLHITIMQIADRYGAQVPPAERAHLAAALTRRLATVPPFTLTVGSCLAQTSVVMFDVHPDDEIGRLGAAVHEAVGAVRGPEALRYHAGIPHMTIGYANGEADNADIQRDLRRVRPSHAPMTIDRVHLVDVAVDATAKTVTWSPIAEIPLGG
ncbi:2'-5' RNA ligase family protein [Actinoplanes sp. DH11]|uniref:2'-5' RNA ligase family protein n=1 Tax=Actinoplanes sp. DH11 TaxID=2857011 RepID=UPI001E3E2C54|nr:2'-5' RNA ligase family protein [Actinoplanes sp. DH11]